MLGQTTPTNAKKSAIKEIREILARGEKLVVCAGSKTWADNLIFNLFEEGEPLDIKYAYYHGMLPDDQLKTALQNVDETWASLDLLIFTPTVTVVSPLSLFYSALLSACRSGHCCSYIVRTSFIQLINIELISLIK